MELPFHLKTLQPLPGALDIIRYFGQNDIITADADTLCDALGLSDRSFSKAIRRLVTKGYILMDGDMVYRLSDQGQDAAEELAAYDATATANPAPAEKSSPVRTTHVIPRRMVAVVPMSMKVNQDAPITIGFHPATHPHDEVDILVRLSVLNGEPSTPQDILFSLTNNSAAQHTLISPGSYDEIRIKLQAYQLGEMGDINEIGGMYIDVPVTAGEANSTQTAYGITLNIQD